MEVEEKKEKSKVEEIKDTAKDLAEHVQEYAETFYKVALLNVTQKATDIASATITAITLLTLGMFALFFGGFALAWWLGDVINSTAGGFAIVAGLFLLLTLIIIFMRKSIVFPYFRNSIIRKLYV